jgi:transposase
VLERCVTCCRGAGVAVGVRPPRRHRSGGRNVTYGPNLTVAAILLASEGNVPIERTAMLMGAGSGRRHVLR